MADVKNTLLALSQHELNKLVREIRREHRCDPIHRVEECELCITLEPEFHPCPVCENRIDMDWDERPCADCVKCDTLFDFCGYKCMNSYMQIWECDCQMRSGTCGVCNNCAREHRSERNFTCQGYPGEQCDKPQLVNRFYESET